ncbi:MAG TPA: DNA-3-methyladenine glycosylase [Propionibacteriaceae bacterium]
MSWDLSRPVAEVAPTLLGAVVRHGEVAIRLTEVEAYEGATDPASHAYRGRTPRNEVMFGPAGFAYLYFNYGMHWCLNVVCGPDGVASGTLLRAGEVVEGLELARSRRGRSKDRDLARGPGRLAQALGLDAEQKGTPLFGGGPVLLEGPGTPSEAILSGPRVGVSAAADRPWRFWLAGNPYVSDYKRSPRAHPRPGPETGDR